MLIAPIFAATISESRSLVFSPSSTPSNAPSCVCSTRTRSTLPSTSDPSRPVPSVAGYHLRRSPWCSRRPRSATPTSPSASSLSRYESCSDTLFRGQPLFHNVEEKHVANGSCRLKRLKLTWRANDFRVEGMGYGGVACFSLNKGLQNLHRMALGNLGLTCTYFPVCASFWDEMSKVGSLDRRPIKKMRS